MVLVFPAAPGYNAARSLYGRERFPPMAIGFVDNLDKVPHCIQNRHLSFIVYFTL